MQECSPPRAGDLNSPTVALRHATPRSHCPPRQMRLGCLDSPSNCKFRHKLCSDSVPSFGNPRSRVQRRRFVRCIAMSSAEAANGRTRFKRIAVYCGSSSGIKPEYANAARELGDELVRRGIQLVYGGSRMFLSTNGHILYILT